MGVTLSRIQQLVSRNHGELLFALGTMSGPISNMVGGIVSARCLQPEELGILNTASLFPAYLTFLQLGVFSGLSRSLPMELGAGRNESANRMLKASGSAATWIAVLGAVTCLSAAAFNQLQRGGNLMTWALVLAALSVFTSLLSVHIDTSLRGQNRFMPLSLITLGTSLLTGISSFLIIWFGILGALLRLAFCSIGALSLRLWPNVWSISWSTDWGTTVALARSGIPLMISGAFFSFVSVADRSIVALLLDKKEVGHFALAGLIVNSMVFVPQSISMILFPKMARHYGVTRSPKGLRKYLLINLGFNLVTIVPISLVAYFAIEPVVTKYFPSYVAGIPAARVACLTCVCWIYLGVGSIIGVLNRMTPYLIAMVVALFLIWSVGCFLVVNGYGIVGAAWARFVGTLFLCIFTIAYSWYLTTLNEDCAKT